MATKDRDRIRQLREEANSLRKQQEAQKRRSRMLAQIGIVAGAVVVVAAIVVLVAFGPRWFSRNLEPATASDQVQLTNTAGASVQVPIKVSAEDGITVGNDDAPAKLDYYFDYSCPHCQDYHKAMETSFEQVIADGQAQVTYHMIRFVADYGKYAGSATAGVVSAAPEKFYDVMNGIFNTDPQTQLQWSYADYASFVKSLGFTDETVLKDISDGHYGQWILDNTDRARRDGIPGTPALAVNGTILENVPATKEDLLQAMNGGSAPADANNAG